MMFHICGTDRAKRSSLVTTRVSPERTNSSASSRALRGPTDDVCSAKTLSHPRLVNSCCWASKPASCSSVEVRAYPTNMVPCRSIEVLDVIQGHVPNFNNHFSGPGKTVGWNVPLG